MIKLQKRKKEDHIRVMTEKEQKHLDWFLKRENKNKQKKKKSLSLISVDH
jgi:demethoxyubiquinone hydroxylase (CLK1/Coq7/Cat5 family)